MKSIIECSDISYRYGQENVLDKIHFTVNQGDYIGLVGPNGSGKSTLLKLMIGLLPLQNGELRLFDEPLSAFRDWSKIGYVSQKANSFNSGFPATVFEVVSMGVFGKLGLFKKLTKKDKENVLEAIDQVGLLDYKDRNIGQLSGGQQQRTFIARALVSKPQLLILDEPTVGIDMASVELFYQLLAKLHDEFHLTLLMVTHDIRTMTKYVNKIAYLNKTIQFHGSPHDFFQQQHDDAMKMYGLQMDLGEVLKL